MTVKRKTLARVAAEKAAVLFQHFGWTYTQNLGKGVEPFVPDVDHLEQTIDRLIEALYDNDATHEIGSGRFIVRRHNYENGDGTCVLLDLAETNVYTGEVMGE